MPTETDSYPASGPSMLIATGVLRRQHTRIGSIGNISLPRSVRILHAAGALVGGFVGLIIGTALFGASVASAMYGAAGGGVIGLFLVTFEPMQGESIATWLTLSVRSRARTLTVDGLPAAWSIGVASIPRSAQGRILILPGGLDIPPGSHDERGVRLDAEPAATVPVPSEHWSTDPSAPRRVTPAPAARPAAPAPGLPPIGGAR